MGPEQPFDPETMGINPDGNKKEADECPHGNDREECETCTMESNALYEESLKKKK
ncbi:MAG TPA: hypothetical protein VJC11_02020 [Patescibacteria group bacterium]|nr:hypothetical protein [Patescibacteria group bacterium]